ncbi:MAG: putative toxin-antitoxin system toxin component, PIN family [Ramlibacter sp.]|nr:putative toxin-antitoxin system toxin component, PIN family [Ramlibacter sp.]
MSDAGPPQGAKAPSGGREGHAVPRVGACVILDTNIVLDAFVFDDAAAQPLREGLAAGALQWLATPAMREELARVLAYPKIVPRLAFYGLDASQVLAAFDRHARVVDAAPRADVACKDADDQKFIDLAVAHGALLLSKDHAVLCMAKRLAARGARAQSAIKSVAEGCPPGPWASTA